MQYSQEHLKSMVYAKFGGEYLFFNYLVFNSYPLFFSIYARLLLTI